MAPLAGAEADIGAEDDPVLDGDGDADANVGAKPLGSGLAGGDDRGVIKNGGADRSRCDVRRDDDGRDANATEREVKRRSNGRDVVWRGQGDRRDVIEDAPVLVVNDEEDAGVPEVVVLANGVVYVLDEGFAIAHVVVGVLVARRQGC